MGQIDKFVNWSVLDKPKNVDVVSVWRNNIWSFLEKWIWLLRQLKKKKKVQNSLIIGIIKEGSETLNFNQIILHKCQNCGSDLKGGN